MIQRKQSIYLLLIAVIVGLLYGLDPAFYNETGKVQADGGPEKVDITVHFQTTHLSAEIDAQNLGIKVTMFGLIGLSLLAIFLFKNRKVQRSLVTFNYLLILILFANMYWYSLGMDYTEMETLKAFLPASISPVPLLLLNFLAQRGIKQDDDLVRSLDRLR